MESEGIGLIDLAAVGREYPQFGRSSWNIDRPKNDVFKGTAGHASCEKSSRCNGEASMDPTLHPHVTMGLCERGCSCDGEMCQCGDCLPRGPNNPGAGSGTNLVSGPDALAMWEELRRLTPVPVVSTGGGILGGDTANWVKIETVIDKVRSHLGALRVGKPLNDDVLRRIVGDGMTISIAMRGLWLVTDRGVNPLLWQEMMSLMGSVGEQELDRFLEVVSGESASQGEWGDFASELMRNSEIPDQWCGAYDLGAWFIKCDPLVWSCIQRFLRMRGVDLEWGRCEPDHKWQMCFCDPQFTPFGVAILLAMVWLLIPQAGPLVVVALRKLTPVPIRL